MTTFVLITLIGEPQAKFIKPNHPPTLICPQLSTRGVLESDGRVRVLSDHPTPSFYPDPTKIIGVEEL